MLKKIPKIITTIFLVAFLFQLIGFIFILTTPEISQAIDVPKLQVPIGEKFSKVNENDETISVPWIGEYISAVYKYAVGIVGILATVVMMFGGVLWITAGGNQERISNAKSWITASLTGLVLVLCSYLILSTVNPDLTRFKPIEISVVEDSNLGCCYWENSDTAEYDIALDGYTKIECEKKDSGNIKGKFFNGDEYYAKGKKCNLYKKNNESCDDYYNKCKPPLKCINLASTIINQNNYRCTDGKEGSPCHIISDCNCSGIATCTNKKCTCIN